MSVSSLPEWKQLLLEKKRREEEERERREKEEEEKLASMPAWKRGIIQRRKAKQEGFGDREKDRDVSLLQVDSRSPSDCLSDTDSSVTVNLGSEPSLSPDPGQWVDAEPKLVSQVSVETIVPVHENPFIRTQSAWRKGRDAEMGNEPEVKEREKDKSSPWSQDGDLGRGRDIELKIERFRDLSQGRERENSRENIEKDKSQWKECKDAGREQECIKVRKDTEEKEAHPPPASFSPVVPCLRTIRADNIIIIEQDRKGSDERKARWREAERERPEEDNQVKRGMKMDLREILAGGGSVTEIRASEVLIIKPSTDPEERSAAGKEKEDGERRSSSDVKRELRTDMSWLREKEVSKEKERPWGQATVINKDQRKDSLDDNVFVDRGGRVSKLLSKFGEHCKAPSRSKSSDNVLQAAMRKYSGDEDEQQSEERRADGKYLLLKGAPKRSFSFSDRVICAKENGLEDNGYYERKTRERIHSDKSLAPWEDVARLGRDTPSKIKLGCARLLDKDRFSRHKKTEDDKEGFVQRSEHRSEVKKAEPVDKRAAEKVGDVDGDKGFTVASVKNTEGISFARRVPIRQDGRARADKEVKTVTGERSLQRELSVEKDLEVGGQTEEEFKSTVQPEAGYVVAASAELSSSCHVDETFYRRDSAFTDCSSLLCTVTDRAAHRGSEWSGAVPRGPYLTHSGLSQTTEDLISKIEKVGDTTVYSNERGERVYEVAQELTKSIKPEVQTQSDHDIIPRSPRRIPPIGVPAGPLEIQIPRSVFYVAEEVGERKAAEGQDWEGGQGVERRDSWRVGKPLSRVESLREKIRQRELERLRQREAQGDDGRESPEVSDTQTAVDRYEDTRTEIEEEWETAAHMRKRLAEAERQEDATAAAAEQTSVAAFDVTQEVDVLKTCPQLPVSGPQSPVESRGEEVISGYAAAASEVISDSFQISEDEDDPLKHEEELRRHNNRHESSEEEEQEEEEEEEEEEKELSVEEVEESAVPLESGQSLSPSPTHPNSLAAMSRIYNLETVGSRTGMCLRDRTVDISSSVHLVRVKPLKSNSQQGDSKPSAGDDIRGVQTIQRQIEQFQLKEQEALKSCTSSEAALKDGDTKEKQSPRRVFKHHLKQDVKTQEKDQGTPEQSPKASPVRVCSPASKKQTITVGPSLLRNQSPDISLKPTDCAPTPASSPCSPSPAPSPSISPSSTPSPTLFSIRSASGGQVKRGATITITPRKPVATGGTVGSTAGPTTGSTAGPTTGSTAGSTTGSTAGSTVRTTVAGPTQTTLTVSESVKKKYPTVEEIEVIGGYQNLEKSCLVKNRVTPKKTKVCFDEEQLEQVCEYPSENFMLAFNPNPHDVGRMERPQGEEGAAEEGEVAKTSVLHKGVMATETAKGPRIKVDESCPR
ncbi:uncharacterized protein ppp1r18 isoform X2 [Mugil cephalus]|uniref:uncharacterized protein ppp1r18 isoform X2 n=1 Tax=Mugil cephalus TaxID=48193 RepID=UPI001FB6B105|nr:uncharacterized protein ppp1r18 isoform X2 [Mugil cephalus]